MYEPALGTTNVAIYGVNFLFKEDWYVDRSQQNALSISRAYAVKRNANLNAIACERMNAIERIRDQLDQAVRAVIQRFKYNYFSSGSGETLAPAPESGLVAASVVALVPVPEVAAVAERYTPEWRNNPCPRNLFFHPCHRQSRSSKAALCSSSAGATPSGFAAERALMRNWNSHQTRTRRNNRSCRFN